MRTVIDIDDASLEAAKKVLGTTTKVATVNSALAEVANREERLSLLTHLDAVAQDLGDDSVMSNAWR